MTDEEFKKAKEYADARPHKFITDKDLEPFIGKECVVYFGDCGFGYNRTARGIFNREKRNNEWLYFCGINSFYLEDIITIELKRSEL